MRCSRCDAENPAGMRFCGQCAAPLPLACPSCGVVGAPEQKFCGQCGARLDPLYAAGFADGAAAPPLPGLAGAAQLAGEIKQVSILFCDIVNSVVLTERLGAEAMRDLVGRFLDIAIGEIQRYDGTAPQFAGDGFMAVFGAPRTQEDHVRRALLAALAIRRALGGEGGGEGGADERPGLDLTIRIGIHSGPVVFGPVGGSFGMATAIGDTANLAARLQQAAEPGVILVSAATRAAAQGYARVEPVGPFAVKGKTEPVEAYRLLGVSRSRTPRDGVGPAHATSFVDRVDEVAALLGFVEEAEAGRGLAVGIVGEPGIGKSRILDQVRLRLAPGRITWAEGRCLSYGTAIPYLLVLDLLRSNCGIVEADSPATIAQKVRRGLERVGMDPDRDGPLLLHLLGVKTVDDRSAASPPEAVKDKAFEIFRRLALDSSSRRPLVLVLEDLHWIDHLSEEFFGFLAEQIGDARILIVATYRPGYRPPWIDKPYARQIALQPLSRDDSLDVLRSVLRDGPLTGPVTEEIVAKADGNPLFLEQLALHAGEAKDRPSELRVPATIHDVVMARIDRLPDEVEAAAADRRGDRPRIFAAPAAGGVAAPRRARISAARIVPSRISRRVARRRGHHLRLPPRADPGSGLWQPVGAAPPRLPRRHRPRARSPLPRSNRRSRRAPRPAFRPQRGGGAGGRLRHRRRRKIPAPLGQHRGADLF